MHRTLIDDRYRVLRPLGSGGMGRVYLARDETLGREVALKVLWEHHAESGEFVERFKREARTAAALHYPNIVSVFDQARARDGAYYIVMEYVPRGTLKEHIERNGPLAVEEAAGAAIQIADALRVAHARGVIHRDVKPQNVFLTEAGALKVGDFGIAQAMWMTSMTATNLILGTVRYLSPEQALGKPVGPASDLYSLGVVLYEMLTGDTPYKASNPVATAMKHVSEPSPSPKDANPRVPEGLNAVVVRLLMKDPAERYGSAAELIEALERAKSEFVQVVAAPGLAANSGGSRNLREERRRGGHRRFLSRSAAAAMFVSAVVMLSGAVNWDELKGVSVGTLLRSDPLSVHDTTWAPKKAVDQSPREVESGMGQGADDPGEAQVPPEPFSKALPPSSQTATRPKASPEPAPPQPPPVQVATPIPSTSQPQEIPISWVPSNPPQPTFEAVMEAAPEQYGDAPQEKAREVPWQGESDTEVAVSTEPTPEPGPMPVVALQYVRAAHPTNADSRLEEDAAPQAPWVAPSAAPFVTTRASISEMVLPEALEISPSRSVEPRTPAMPPDVPSPGLPDALASPPEGTPKTR